MSVELEKRGFKVSRPRPARMMKASDLQARRKRKFKHTTDSNHSYPIAPNRLNRRFTTSRKSEVWVSDITYIETAQGWYIAVGNRPIRQRLIFHSDRGSQYACTKFRNILKSYQQVQQSMSRKGNCWDTRLLKVFLRA